ncbi:MAG: XTP/dITP diphosphatase [Candidatus Omnitrophica bacterium]|nr:XTP/dITP diphosphatase [Candidatus Omnitrophota bacterium]
MTELVVATTNKKKKKELVALLKGLNVKILGLDDFKGAPKVREDKKTFKENAIKKAVVLSRFTGRLTLAEDSGLEVSALGGLPGVRSARFAGPSKNDAANIRRLLKMLKGIPFSKRKARFTCFAAIAENGRLIKAVSASVRGVIALEPRGESGFGYDPVFYYPPFKKAFGEVSASRKNKVSHRSRALTKIKKILREVL